MKDLLYLTGSIIVLVITLSILAPYFIIKKDEKKNEDEDDIL